MVNDSLEETELARLLAQLLRVVNPAAAAGPADPAAGNGDNSHGSGAPGRDRDGGDAPGDGRPGPGPQGGDDPAGAEEPAGRGRPDTEPGAKAPGNAPPAAAQSDAPQSEGGQAEGGQAEGGQSEGGQSEGGQAEAGKSEGGKSEAGKSEAAQGEAAQGEAAAGPEPEAAGLAAISASEARALIELVAARGIAQGELGGLLGLEKSTVSRLAAGLERKGWIRRGRDEDNQRYVRLYLTPQGRSVADRVLTAWQSRQERVLAALTADERAGLEVGLRGLVRSLAAERVTADLPPAADSR